MFSDSSSLNQNEKDEGRFLVKVSHLKYILCKEMLFYCLNLLFNKTQKVVLTLHPKINDLLIKNKRWTNTQVQLILN